LFVPDLKVNLVSVSQLVQDEQWEVTMHNAGGSVRSKTGELILSLGIMNNLYYIKTDQHSCFYSNGMTKIKDIYLWHLRLGHIHEKTLNSMGLQGNLPFCADCIKGKGHEKPFKSKRDYQESTLARIHSDTVGPLLSGIGGEIYFITVVDEHSRYVLVEFMTRRSEV
jgi:hypothetical protein